MTVFDVDVGVVVVAVSPVFDTLWMPGDITVTHLYRISSMHSRYVDMRPATQTAIL